jgi:hypothetical protein
MVKHKDRIKVVLDGSASTCRSTSSGKDLFNVLFGLGFSDFSFHISALGAAVTAQD